MRRALWLGLLLGTVALTGCEGIREAFSPQANMVAVAAGRRLPTDRVVALLTRIPGTPQPEAASLVADLWVDLQLFAQARIEGTLPGDSLAVERIMWPQLLQGRMRAWQDTLAARRPPLTDEVVDSAYAEGTARLFQHVIVVPEGVTARDSTTARARITSLLAQARRGADFGGLARQNTDMSREDQGFLPVGPRGQFVPEFEEAAWQLAPGEVSDVVESSFGFHLIRRTPVDEARPRMTEYLQQSVSQRLDSLYIADLARANDLKVQANAPQLMRDAAGDLDAARRSSRRIATFGRAALTVSDFARWMEALPPGAPRQFVQQPDSVLRVFAEGLAQNQLVIRQIDSAGIEVPVATWQALELAYRATVDQMAQGVGLMDSVVADTTLPAAQRLDSASSRIERYLDLLVSGEVQYRPFPSPLSTLLRERGRYRINRAGITRALELATAQARADSAADPGGGGPPPVIQPAPGGPPVPGAEPGR